MKEVYTNMEPSEIESENLCVHRATKISPRIRSVP